MTAEKNKQPHKAGSGANRKGNRKADEGKSPSGMKCDRHIKAPSGAATYLLDWERRDSEDSTWKFNKNTQSWLIRHMYEVDKVSKSSFAILLKYLEGLNGDSARSRIRSEASRRALRYRKHQEKGSEGTTKEKPMRVSMSGETPSTEAMVSGSETVEVEMDEEERWQQLSEHDKRKEYKRARKVLETVVVK
ncbi:unnamed protein product [Cylindrotheca closterium]|uniref:WKF domain-containing protein n=1 Tax=Cylindrotheca closterium TaxID=2856 RepID=A0AAD2JGK1_9STRA|nr:unnamed protein product [Cylindrotheca closterium]